MMTTYDKSGGRATGGRQGQRTRVSREKISKETIVDGRTRRRVLKSGVVGGVAGVAGCTGLLADPPIDQLKASVFDVRTPSVGGTSATLPIVLQLQNPADGELPDLSGDFTVYINSEQVASTKSHFGTLTAGEASKQPIKPIIEYAKSGGAIIKAIRNNHFRLKIDTTFRSKGAATTTRMTYEYSG